MIDKEKIDKIINNFHKFAENLPYEKKILLYSFENFVINIAANSLQWSYGKFLGRWKNITNFSRHVFWILLWKLKLILKKNSNKPSILIQSIPNSKSSNAFIELLSKKYYIYNIGALENIKLFCNPKVYCVVNTMQTKNNDLIIDEIINILKVFLSENNIKISLNDEKELNILKKRFFVMQKLLEAIKDKIILFISDSYLTPQTYFVQYLSKTKFHIKSIIIDHGIVFYSNLYNKIWSDFYLACGEYNYLRVTNKIKKDIIGIPSKKFKFSSLQKYEQKIILYILSPYIFSAARTSGRNLFYLQKYLSKLNTLFEKYFPEHKFYLRAHPVDDIKTLKKMLNLYNIYQGNLKKILKNIDFCFFEDTSLAIDFLNYDIPLIYVPDEFNNEHIHFKKFDFDISLCYDQISYENLKKILDINKIKAAKKQNIYEYYFSPFDEKKFWKIINETIKSNSSNSDVQSR